MALDARKLERLPAGRERSAGLCLRERADFDLCRRRDAGEEERGCDDPGARLTQTQTRARP
jgi:hypothetical protein